MTTFRQTAVLLAAALLAAPGALRASEAALGDGGKLYRLTAGTYADLFPDGTAAEPDAAVLALDVIAPGEPRLRWLVPGSESPAVDLSPALVFEPGSQVAYAIWESRRDSETSAILLAGFREGAWFGPVEIASHAAPLKQAPTVLITRDEFGRADVTEGQVRTARTVLHVLWWERSEGGKPIVRYSPVVFEDGAYVGWNPVFRLDALDPNEPTEEATGSPDLVRAPALSVGTDVHTVMIAFANPRTGKLLTVQARVLPGELGLLADRIPDAVVAAGYSDGDDPLAAIRGALRSHVIEIGDRFNPAVIEHFADAAVAAAEVLYEAKPNRPIAALADELRSHVIEIGASLLGGVERPTQAKASRVLEVTRLEAEAAQVVSSLVELRLVRDLPVPEGVAGASRIYASEDGTRLLVSWKSGRGIFYSESLPEGAGGASWTVPLALELGEEADEAEIDAILRARVLQRP